MRILGNFENLTIEATWRVKEVPVQMRTDQLRDYCRALGANGGGGVGHVLWIWTKGDRFEDFQDMNHPQNVVMD